MQSIQGGCYCGNLKFQAGLTRSTDSYAPRACDCDFCAKHAAAYVSDPEGTLQFQVCDPDKLTRFRQSPEGAAEFLICAVCGVLVGVVHETYGAINARAVEEAHFGAPVQVSPKTLEPQSRQERWKQVWFRRVGVQEGV